MTLEDLRIHKIDRQTKRIFKSLQALIPQLGSIGDELSDQLESFQPKFLSLQPCFHIGVCGQSGSGKSNLISVLSQLATPDSHGETRFHSFTLTEVSPNDCSMTRLAAVDLVLNVAQPETNFESDLSSVMQDCVRQDKVIFIANHDESSTALSISDSNAEITHISAQLALEALSMSPCEERIELFRLSGVSQLMSSIAEWASHSGIEDRYVKQADALLRLLNDVATRLKAGLEQSTLSLRQRQREIKAEPYLSFLDQTRLLLLKTISEGSLELTEAHFHYICDGQAQVKVWSRATQNLFEWLDLQCAQIGRCWTLYVKRLIYGSESDSNVDERNSATAGHEVPPTHERSKVMRKIEDVIIKLQSLAQLPTEIEDSPKKRLSELHVTVREFSFLLTTLPKCAASDERDLDSAETQSHRLNLFRTYELIEKCNKYASQNGQ